MKRGRLGRVLAAGLLATLWAGCQDGAPAMPPGPPVPLGPGWTGTLDVEIRDAVDVQILDKGEGVIDVTLRWKGATYQPLDPAQPYRATGRIERIPEAATDLYVAKFPAVASTGGLCAGQPLSLALSLARRQGNVRVGGGLSIYCGSNVYSGTPARILRLTGKLPANPPT